METRFGNRQPNAFKLLNILPVSYRKLRIAGFMIIRSFPCCAMMCLTPIAIARLSHAIHPSDTTPIRIYLNNLLQSKTVISKLPMQTECRMDYCLVIGEDCSFTFTCINLDVHILQLYHVWRNISHEHRDDRRL